MYSSLVGSVRYARRYLQEDECGDSSAEEDDCHCDCGEEVKWRHVLASGMFWLGISRQAV